jgi:3-deoxy-D-manno-octulosonic acid kinase
VQVDLGDHVHLLDFDKGRIRAPGVWRQKNMARLHRSLQKIKMLDERVYFSRQDWDLLLDGYFSASRSA